MGLKVTAVLPAVESGGRMEEYEGGENCTSVSF